MTQISKPIHEEVMNEIAHYDRAESLEEIAEILWRENAKLALWLCTTFEIPF